MIRSRHYDSVFIGRGGMPHGLMLMKDFGLVVRDILTLGGGLARRFVAAKASCGEWSSLGRVQGSITVPAYGQSQRAVPQYRLVLYFFSFEFSTPTYIIAGNKGGHV